MLQPLLSRHLLPLASALSLALLFALACGGDSERPIATPFTPVPNPSTPASESSDLSSAEGEAVLNSAALSDSDLPGGWAIRDHLNLHPTPFGFQPEILDLLRKLSYEAALFIEFSQSLGTEDPQFIEQSLFLYPDEAAAGEAYEVATAESALPFFFGG